MQYVSIFCPYNIIKETNLNDRDKLLKAIRILFSINPDTESFLIPIDPIVRDPAQKFRIQFKSLW